VPPYEIVSPFELLPYMLAGVVAGLVAVTFIKSIAFFEDFFEKVPVPEPLRASIGGALVGVIAVWLPQVYGVGYTTIGMALAGSMTAAVMAVLVIAKIAATSITIGSGGSGGVFAPSLFLGAMSGGVVGTMVEQYFPGATASSGAYALVTMGAVVAAATHAPISAIIIIYELTLAIEIIPALMTACVVSTLVSQLLNRESIYTSKLMRQGVDIYQREDPNVLKGLFVRDVLDPGAEVIPESTNFQTILDLVVQSSHSQFFVVSAEGHLLGAISLLEVRRLIYELDNLQHLIVARDLVDTQRPTVKPSTDLSIVMHLFSGTEVDEIAVIDPADPRRMIGTVREKDVIDVANQEQIRRDLAGGLSSGVDAVAEGQTVELGGGYILKEMMAPAFMIGRNLRETRIRERTQVQVLLIRSVDKARPVRVASAEDRFVEGETLVVAGSREGVRQLEHLQD
jgi:CIC family chloride channel protein